MHRATTVRGNKHLHSRYNLQNDLKNIKAALADASDDVRGRVGEILYQSAQDVKDKTIDVRDTVSDYISEKPLKSVGIAVLTGFIFGYLFRK